MLMSRLEFFQGLGTLYPQFAPWKTPAYSNIAFQILAYALENMTGRPFNESLYNNVMQPLDLQNTYYYRANESLGIIPRDVNKTGWLDYLGDESP